MQCAEVLIWNHYYFKALVNICAIIGHNWNKFTKQVSICLPHSADNEIRRISFVRKPFFISYQIKTDLRENIFPFRHSTISPLPSAQINYARRAQLEPPSTQPIAKGIGRRGVKERESCVLVLSNCFSFGASPERKSPFHAELLIELHGIMSRVCVLCSVCVCGSQIKAICYPLNRRTLRRFSYTKALR